MKWAAALAGLLAGLPVQVAAAQSLRTSSGESTATVFRTSTAEGPEREAFLEFSVGSILSFPGDLVSQYGDDIDLVPVTGALFLIEYFFHDALRAVFVYDLALTPDQRVVGGAFTQEVVESKAFLGINWTPFRFDLPGNTRLELQGMALGGLVVTSPPPFIPGLLGRIHVSSLPDGASGVGAYLGVSYYGRINTVGPVYGIGYRF